MEKKMMDFLVQLSGKEPVPGGGGAAALAAAMAAALASMVANLTVGKKQYADVQEDIACMLNKIEKKIWVLYDYIEKDAQAFAPLADLYRLPKEAPGREEKVEQALLRAAEIPLALLQEVNELIPILEELEEKGSRMAISDVAVAASCCRTALESGVVNVYINTASMKNREAAEEMDRCARALVMDGCSRCQELYERIEKKLCRS